MKRLLFVAILVALASPSFAQWKEVSSRSEAGAAPGLSHRRLEVRDSVSGDDAVIDVALFPAKSTQLRIVDSPEGTTGLGDAMAESGCLAGVNGGYFDPNFAPLGLRVRDGKIAKPLVRARLLTGVLVSAPGSIRILRVSEYSAQGKVVAAVQCGPLLVDHNAPVKGLEQKRMARRTFAAVGSDWTGLGFCSGVSLGQLAQILADVPLAEKSKTQRALNLDGGSSSAFWFKRAAGSVFSIPESKYVRDFVGVVPAKN